MTLSVSVHFNSVQQLDSLVLLIYYIFTGINQLKEGVAICVRAQVGQLKSGEHLTVSIK